MSKYSTLFTQKKNLYTEGSPISLEAGILSKSNESGNLIAQIKFRSICTKTIKYLKLTYAIYDPMGEALSDSEIFEYLDLNISRNEEFGAKRAIPISNRAVRSFSVKNIFIGFTDGSSWDSGNAEWDAIPTQNSISNEFKDNDLAKGFQFLFGSQSVYAPKSYKDLWLCACGHINHIGEAHCNHCQAALDQMINIEPEELRLNSIYGQATSLMDSNSNLSDYKKAKALLSNLPSTPYVASLIERCEMGIGNVEQAIKEKKQKKISYTALIPFCLLAVAVVLDIAERIASWGETGEIIRYSYMFISVICIVFLVRSGIKSLKTNSEASRYSFWHAVLALVSGGALLILSVVITECSFSDDFDPLLAYIQIFTTLLLIIAAFFVLFASAKEKTKKIILASSGIACSITIILLFYVFPCSYSKNYDGTYTLTNIRAIPLSGEITISEKHMGKPVTHIGKKAFIRNYGLKKITLPDSIVSIEDYAFYICDSLEEITLSDSLTSIGIAAFSRCENLQNIVIPDSVTTINRDAFSDCSGLTSITISSTITSIEDSTFSSCSALTSVTIPNTVTSIECSAFRRCSNLTTIVYNGTKAQWDAINKQVDTFWGYSNWDADTGNYVIYCTDGIINK